jgi:hypothetical protein
MPKEMGISSQAMFMPSPPIRLPSLSHRELGHQVPAGPGVRLRRGGGKASKAVRKVAATKRRPVRNRITAVWNAMDRLPVKR